MRIFFMLFLLAGSPFWPFGSEVLPGDPLIIINKKTNELVWVNHGKVQLQTKVATGKTNELTPEGLFTVKVKAVNPYYRKKDIPGGDPHNPLGSRWIGFDAKGTDGRIYGLHGTNQPHTIGSYVSEGCIRISKVTLEDLYDQVPEGTRMLITNTDKSFEQLASEAGAF